MSELNRNKHATTNLAGFDQYVAQLKLAMKRQYDRGVNKDLSQQNRQSVLKRNVTLVLKQAYNDALTQLQSQSIAADGVEVENALSTNTDHPLTPLHGFIDELMQYALHKHRTSCALSNFPDEHKPSQEYIVEVLQAAEQDWQAFTQQVHALGLR